MEGCGVSAKGQPEMFDEVAHSQSLRPPHICSSNVRALFAQERPHTNHTFINTQLNIQHPKINKTNSESNST